MARHIKYDVSLGKRIQRLRNDRSLSQKALADSEIGISLPTIQRYESGELPGAKGLDKIVNYYKCSKSWLLTGEGVPYPDKPQEKHGDNQENIKFNSIADEVKDLPTEELDHLIDGLKKLSKKDTARIISRLTTCSRRGDIDSSLLKCIHAAMKEFFSVRDKKELDSLDFAASLVLHTIYRELRKEPSREELIAIIEALYQLGMVYPVGVPLTPNEQRELLTWGRQADIKK